MLGGNERQGKFSSGNAGGGCLAGMNSKGQAAVTDALFFLLIVGILSSALFAFAINYGNTVQKYISSQYMVDFQTTALKTMLYSSVPRDEGKTIFDAPQVDYLLAIVKEDYLDDANLSENSKTILRNASKIALKPLSSSFDYLFFIQTTEQANNFVFIYLNSSACNVELDERGRCSETKHEEYYCNAKNLQNIQRFLEEVGAFTPVASGIKLSKINPRTKNPETVSAIAELAMWLGAPIEALKGKVIVVTYADLGAVNFNMPGSIGCNPDASMQCQGILVCRKITQ